MLVAATILAIPPNAAHELGERPGAPKLLQDEQIDTTPHSSTEVHPADELVVDQRDRHWRKLAVGLGVKGGQGEAFRKMIPVPSARAVKPFHVNQSGILRASGVHELLPGDGWQVLWKGSHDGDLAVVHVDTKSGHQILLAGVLGALERGGCEADKRTFERICFGNLVVVKDESIAFVDDLNGVRPGAKLLITDTELHCGDSLDRSLDLL